MDKEIKDYLNGLSELQKQLVSEIREVVLKADPNVKEGIKWGSIAFFNKKNICGFRVAKQHVTLLFMEGASLDDSHGILQGDGAKARTYKYTAESDLQTEALQDLVRQALQAGS